MNNREREAFETAILKLYGNEFSKDELNWQSHEAKIWERVWQAAKSQDAELIAEFQADRNRLDAKTGQDSYDIGYSFAKQESASIIAELVEALEYYKNTAAYIYGDRSIIDNALAKVKERV